MGLSHIARASNLYYESQPNEWSSLHVEARALDEIVPPGGEVHWVKLDAEGAELEVLCSGLELLRRSRHLGLELNFVTTPVREGLRIRALLSGLGFVKQVPQGLPGWTWDAYFDEKYIVFMAFFRRDRREQGRVVREACDPNRSSHEDF